MGLITSQNVEIKFKKPPSSFAFCFPYLFSLSASTIETQNLIQRGKRVYDSITVKGAKKIMKMGRNIIVATEKEVHSIVLDTHKYYSEQEFEEKMKIIAQNENLDPLSQFLSSLMNTPNNPCFTVLESLCSNFNLKFKNVLNSEVPLSVDHIKLIKDHTGNFLNFFFLKKFTFFFKLDDVLKMLNVIFSIFPEILQSKNMLSIESAQRSVHSCYFDKIHDVLFSVLQKIYKEENDTYNGYLNALSNATLDDLDVEKIYQLKKNDNHHSNNSQNNEQNNDLQEQQQHKIIPGNKIFQAQYLVFNNNKFEQEISVTVYLALRLSPKKMVPLSNSNNLALIPKKKKNKLLLCFEKPVPQSCPISNSLYYNSLKNSVIWYDNSKLKFCELIFPSSKIFREFQQEAINFDRKQELLENNNNPIVNLIENQNHFHHKKENSNNSNLPYKKAIDEFSLLPTFTNAQKKFECIHRTTSLIKFCIDEYLKQEKMIEDSNDIRILGVDETVPILAYVVLKSKVKDLFSHIHFLEHFYHDQVTLEKGEYGSLLVSLITAIDCLRITAQQK